MKRLSTDQTDEQEKSTLREINKKFKFLQRQNIQEIKKKRQTIKT